MARRRPMLVASVAALREAHVMERGIQTQADAMAAALAQERAAALAGVTRDSLYI